MLRRRHKAAIMGPMSELQTHSEFDENMFQQARQEFLTPKPLQTGSLVYLLLFLFFIVPQFDGLKSVPGIIVLVLVILFHEVGHMIGMWAFGFQDVRMYFIPFFGAAASGRPLGAAAWKHALVSLLGPLPGIVVGLGALFLFASYPIRLLFTAINTLLLLNVFNLLPFGGLDGGRFLQSVLFSRHRVLEVLFFAMGSAALILVALYLNAPILAIFSLLGLVGLPARWRILKAASALRHEHPHLEPNPTKLSDAEERAVFAAANTALQARGLPPPSIVATTMHTILDAAQRPPSVRASLGLIMLYLATWCVALAGFVLLSVHTGGPVEWKVVEQDGWRAEFPAQPHAQKRQEHTPSGPRPAKVSQTIINGVERFSIEVVDGGKPFATKEWIDTVRDRFIAKTGAKLSREMPVTTAGMAGRELVLTNTYRVWHSRFYVSGTKLYFISVSAPEWGENQSRFFDSFTFVSPPAPLPSSK